MVLPTRPAGTKAYLTDKWVWVPTLANPSAPTVTECNGATALDVTLMFYASSAKPSQTTNLARAPKRIGDGESYEFVGETQRTLGEMRYAINPQGAALSDGQKAYEKFQDGATGYFVRRRGINRLTDLAVGNKVWVYPAECGPAGEGEEGEGEGAETAIVQTFAQTGPTVKQVALVA